MKYRMQTILKIFFHPSYIIKACRNRIRKVFNYKNNHVATKKLLKTPEFKKNVIKKNINIYLFANVPYHDIGGGQRSASLAKTFNAMGYNVCYFYAYNSINSRHFFGAIPCTIHEKIDNRKAIKIINKITSKDIAIFESPSKRFNTALEIIKKSKAKIIYENIDNWETTLGTLIYDKETLTNMIESAHILVGTSIPLVKQLNNYLQQQQIKKDILYLPNAVDNLLFLPQLNYDKPKDLVTSVKTLLYYGSLYEEWFDWDLIIKLAIKNPTYSINIIGNTNGLETIISQCPESIHFLGIKKQSELPNYLKYSNYTLIPFKNNDISKYVSPLKIFEYMAMNKPVLSTELQDIINYPNCFFSNEYEKWNKYLKLDVQNIDNSSFIADNSWYARCISLLNNQKKSKYYKQISIVVLNYNNMNVIFNCIDSLIKYNNNYMYDIIIVDNQSTDGSYEELIKKYKYNKLINILRNNKNGCSSGRNLGFQYSKRKYILFLDSDQWVLHSSWLDSYLEILSIKKDVGAIGWIGGFFNRKGCADHSTNDFVLKYMSSNLLAHENIGYLATAGFLIKRKTLLDIDGFDIKYDPTCYEDTDLSLKIRNINKKIYYCPYLGVGHIPHQTTGTNKQNSNTLFVKNGKYFINKWVKINPKLIYKYIIFK